MVWVPNHVRAWSLSASGNCAHAQSLSALFRLHAMRPGWELLSLSSHIAGRHSLGFRFQSCTRAGFRASKRKTPYRRLCRISGWASFRPQEKTADACMEVHMWRF